jgi:hypothetical protein
MAKMTLDVLVTQLRAAFGAELRAVALYGSAAAGGHNPKTSDHNILVIVDSLGPERLAAVSATISAWSEAGNTAPLLLTTQEWQSSADIFAMEYADILQRHRLLHGALPDGVRVDTQFLRLQLEHEAMGALLQLRRGTLAAGGDGKALLAMLARSSSSMMALFRAVVRLRGDAPSADNAELCQSVSGITGLDAAPFVSAVRHRRGEATLKSGEAAVVVSGCLDGLQRVVRYLDQFKQRA